jgi:hypothetical protein
MVIKSDGKVGVGTTNPGNSKLCIDLNTITTDITHLTMQASYNGVNGGYLEFLERKHTPSNNTWLGWGTRIQKIVDVTRQGYIEFNPVGSGYDIAFGNDGGGGSGEIMRIDGQNGRVGIGTVSPNSLLTFYKDYNVPSNGSEPADDTTQGITFRSDLNSYAGSPAPTWSNSSSPVDVAKIWFQPHSYQDISGSAGVHGYLAFGTGYFGSQSSTPDMVIDTSGNVGIGTTNPTRKLHVEGEIGLYGEKLLQAVIGYQHYTNTSTYQSTATNGGYFDCFNFNYNRKRSDSTIHIRAFLCPAQAFGDNGYRNTHRAVYVKLVFTENSGTVTESYYVRDWERQDYGFHEYQRIVYIKHNNTFTGSTSGQNINIKAQVSSSGNSGTMGRWGINIWTGRSTVEVYETLY